MTPLNEKIVLVTGAGRGIGLALVRRFLAGGAQVIGTVRSDRAEHQLRAACPDPALVIERCDVTRESDAAALAARLARAPGRVDVLINNAGVFLDRGTPVEALDGATLQATLATNLFGPVALCAALLPLIPRGGRIINVSSTLGQLGDGGLRASGAAYGISKAALNAYTTALANALRPREIFVDAMHPGWVKTDMGGAGAPLDPPAATETAYFLATREGGPTGSFWDRSEVTAW